MNTRFFTRWKWVWAHLNFIEHGHSPLNYPKCDEKCLVGAAYRFCGILLKQSGARKLQTKNAEIKWNFVHYKFINNIYNSNLVELLQNAHTKMKRAWFIQNLMNKCSDAYPEICAIVASANRVASESAEYSIYPLRKLY